MLKKFFILAISILQITASVYGDTSLDSSAIRDFAFQILQQAHFEFDGELGQCIKANTDQWLLPATQANPGMLEMFALRDRQPVPNLVPWAGEFVGKYLLSAMLALRQDYRPELKKTIEDVIRQLISLQASDGYLGPFPQRDRLRGNWDLWGHYHCMQALLYWHITTGDAKALECCRRMGDLICNIFLDGKMRIYDAGSHEMNMAIIHSLGWLYRITGEPEYRQMVMEIAKDWERAGDYARAGLSGKEFYESPRPRWESLHDLQGLLELFLITGDANYRESFKHHWRSIARWDLRNTYGFSSGEQATGNPYSPTAIETCCTVAWMALTMDMLRLTGDSRVADVFEMSLFNAALGAQHPSGRWWTYNTPMDGIREASAHSIVFQSRHGTPELNCCSVNGPRALGMLSEWAVMACKEGLILNHYGPFVFQGKTPKGAPITLRCQSQYPLDGRMSIGVELDGSEEMSLLLRIPQWASNTEISVNNQKVGGVKTGAYYPIQRIWKKRDQIDLAMNMEPRCTAGAREAYGKISLYRGPVLLAYDQRLNRFDENSLPMIDLGKISSTKLISTSELSGRQPWLVADLTAADNRTVRLCDFASAGSAGTRYRSWLPATNSPPPPSITRYPPDAASLPAGKLIFKWTGPKNNNTVQYRLIIKDTESGQIVFDRQPLNETKLIMEKSEQFFSSGHVYEWQVTASNKEGAAKPAWPEARFQWNPALPPLEERLFVIRQSRPDGLLVAASLQGKFKPEVGQMVSSPQLQAVPGPSGNPGGAVQLDGNQDRITYQIDEFPEENYSAAFWIRVLKIPDGRIGQAFSAWSASMDDPLRICIDKGRIFARIEAGQGYSTEGIPFEHGQWMHIAAVKAADALILYVKGVEKARVTVPMFMHSGARDFALGGNPHYGGNEFLAAQFAEIRFYERALTSEEIRAMAAGRSENQEKKP